MTIEEHPNTPQEHVQIFDNAIPEMRISEMVTKSQLHARHIYSTKDPAQVNCNLRADMPLKIVIPAIHVKTLSWALNTKNQR